MASEVSIIHVMTFSMLLADYVFLLFMVGADSSFCLTVQTVDFANSRGKG